MAYRFRKSDHSATRALRRIAREQFDKAIATIDDEADPALAIHAVRTRCKKLRGLLRLVRPTFEAYEPENADLRDTAGLLGGSREAAVLIDTFDRLVRRYGRVAPATQARFRQASLPLASLDRSSERLAEARDRLVTARSRVEGWSLAADGWEAIGPGFMHTLVRARETLAQVDQSEDVDLRHELRKHVKYHWHHLRLLRAIAPKQLGPRAELAAEVADRLGDYHDLAMMEAFVRGHRKACGTASAANHLLALARRHRELTEQQCLRLARLLLADGAGRLTRRLGEKWREWAD